MGPSRSPSLPPSLPRAVLPLTPSLSLPLLQAGGDKYDAMGLQEKAKTRVDVKKDAGYTRADGSGNKYICLYFARGCCPKGCVPISLSLHLYASTSSRSDPTAFPSPAASSAPTSTASRPRSTSSPTRRSTSLGARSTRATATTWAASGRSTARTARSTSAASRRRAPRPRSSRSTFPSLARSSAVRLLAPSLLSLWLDERSSS